VPKLPKLETNHQEGNEMTRTKPIGLF